MIGTTRSFYKSYFVSFLIAASLITVVVSVVSFPEASFQSSLKSLRIWWDIVFPALLPFFILMEIAEALGLLHGLGLAFAPAAHRIFRIPGIGSWAIAFGATIGFPAGAKMTTKLKQKGSINTDQGNRLLAISHIAGPVTTIAAIGVGFFHSAQLGWFLFLIQWISLAVMLPFLRSQKPAAVHLYAMSNETNLTQSFSSLWKRIPEAVADARKEDGRSFGQILGDAVSHSVQTLMVIGGTMMMFSVVTTAIEHLPFEKLLSIIIGKETSTHWETNLHLVLTGIFEPHLGAALISQSSLPFIWQISLVSAILAWSGLAFHLQVQSLISRTGLSYRYFLYAKLWQTIIAFIASFLLWKPFAHCTQASYFVSSVQNTENEWSSGILPFHTVWKMWSWELGWLAAILCFMLGLSFFSKVRK